MQRYVQQINVPGNPSAGGRVYAWTPELQKRTVTEPNEFVEVFGEFKNGRFVPKAKPKPPTLGLKPKPEPTPEPEPVAETTPESEVVIEAIEGKPEPEEEVSQPEGFENINTKAELETWVEKNLPDFTVDRRKSLTKLKQEIGEALKGE
jgi:hypothetical protein